MSYTTDESGKRIYPDIQIGDTAPDFTAKNQKGEDINLYSLLQKGQKVLLVFYPADQTPGCTKQLCGIRDVYKEYSDAGVTVLGVNKGNAESHQKFIDAQSYQFDILVDTDMEITESYGAMKKYFDNYIVKRGVFLIDSDKKVLYRFWGQQDNSKILDLLKN
jgi:peroxiredoxin Q/BCP